MFDSFKRKFLPEIDNQTTPPSPIPPSVAARSLGVFKRKEAAHLAAIPFDLAERGYLTIAQHNKDVIFSRTEKPAEELPHLFDQLFLKDMFGLTGYTPFRQLGPRLVQMRKSLHTQIGKTAEITKVDDTAAWRGFRSYLQQKGAVKDPSEFGRYLPYAIAFGVDIEWGIRFINQPKVAMPHWYETLEPAGMLIEILRIAQTMEHQLKTKISGVSIPFDESVSMQGAHPIGKGVFVIVTPAG